MFVLSNCSFEMAFVGCVTKRACCNSKENRMYCICFGASFTVFNSLLGTCAEQMGFFICDLRVAFQFHQLTCSFPIIFLPFSPTGSSPSCTDLSCEGKSLIAKARWVIFSQSWCIACSRTNVFSKQLCFLSLVTIAKDWNFTVLRLIFFFNNKNQVHCWI